MLSCPETLALCVCPASAAHKAESFPSYCRSTTVAPGGLYSVTQPTVHQSALQAAAALTAPFIFALTPHNSGLMVMASATNDKLMNLSVHRP